MSLSRCAGCVAWRRYVSGWMFEADRDGPVESHAWAEVNVPGIGWVEEDPTHVLRRSHPPGSPAGTGNPGAAAKE